MGSVGKVDLKQTKMLTGFGPTEINQGEGKEKGFALGGNSRH